MTSAPAKYAQYLADFQFLVQGPGANAPAWLRDLRDNAWSTFNEIGFPTARRGNERWKYTNVAPIARTGFGLAPSPATANGSKAVAPTYKLEGPAVYDLVFLDGHYSPELSSPAAGPSGVTAASMASAALDNAFDLESQVGRYAPVDDDGFAALNTAF